MGWAAAEPAHLHFLSRAEAVAVLTQRDEFVEQLSPFDRQARLQAATAVTSDQFLGFAGEQALEWDSAQVRQVELAFELTRLRLAELPLPGPDTVEVILTTGREEGNAAYTRGQAIVLPLSKLQSQNLPELLTHELFHVLSRANPEWRDALYRRLGFERNIVELPADLVNRRITNPDAPLLQWTWETLLPVTHASTPDYDPKKGGLFAFLQFSFWSEKGLVPVPESYRQRYGKNTGYFIHPEEILAEHFVFLVWEKDVPDPALVKALREWLRTAQNEP